MRYLRSITTLVLGCLVLAPAGLTAQGRWLGATPRPGLTLEVIRPVLDGGRTDIGSVASYLSFRHGLGERTVLVAELPFARASYDYPGVPEVSSTAIGNPYLGVRWASATSPFALDLGVRAPLAPEGEKHGNAEMIGIIADMDRMEAFLPKTLTFEGIASTAVQAAERPVSLRLLLGPSLLVYAGEEDFEDNSELFVLYGAQLWADAGRAEFGAGVIGRAVLTESDLDFDERSMHQLGITANLKLAHLRPGVSLRLPLDEHTAQEYAIGLQLTVPLRR